MGGFASKLAPTAGFEKRTVVVTAKRLRDRVEALDWGTLHESLDEFGYSLTPPLLSPAECGELVAFYEHDHLFRNTVDMARHAFGVGQYRYFAEPVPALVASLRETFYTPLARVANRWAEQLRAEEMFPMSFAAYRERCRVEGQIQPTPLLLRYEAGGYNCLHQDRYGELSFPLQLTFMLSCPQTDFRGGEFLLVEQRPRMQSRGNAVSIEQGQCIVFPNQVRPVRGARGFYRVQVRHGVSRIHAGGRNTLGIIFHDAA